MRYLLMLAVMMSVVSVNAIGDDVFEMNRKLGRGVNLGNALEAPAEGKWGVRLKEDYFRLIAAAGFDSVRIPVRWSAHAGDASPYKIDRDFLARVDWAVDQALTNGLCAVMNVHHYEEMAKEPLKHKERFLGIWAQLAAHYKDRPPALLFEPMNEPNHALTSEMWNGIVAEAIGTIRKTNPTRIIVVGPGKWNNVKELPRLKLPEDDRNLIATFHYYLPFKFTHQGASWAGEQSAEWLGTTWEGTDEERKAVADDLAGAVRWARENNRPLYMGEFGAYSKADMVSRSRWTSFVRKEAERRGMSWAYWEFCAGFGVYDQKSNAWRNELKHALLGP